MFLTPDSWINVMNGSLNRIVCRALFLLNLFSRHISSYFDVIKKIMASWSRDRPSNLHVQATPKPSNKANWHPKVSFHRERQSVSNWRHFSRSSQICLRWLSHKVKFKTYKFQTCTLSRNFPVNAHLENKTFYIALKALTAGFGCVNVHFIEFKNLHAMSSSYRTGET